jgi:hypothetical protein
METIEIPEIARQFIHEEILTMTLFGPFARARVYAGIKSQSARKGREAGLLRFSRFRAIEQRVLFS